MKQIMITTSDLRRLRAKITDPQVRAGNINKLNDEMARAEIIEPDKVPGDVITMNSKVKIFNLDMKKSMVVQLVYPEEADIKSQKISIFAPIGTALLGFRKGDIIEWEVPKGKTKIRIDDIVYQPEAAGDFHL